MRALVLERLTLGRFEEDDCAEGELERFLLLFCFDELDFPLLLLVLLLLGSCFRLLESFFERPTGDLLRALTLGEWVLELPLDGEGERESSLDNESLRFLRLELLDFDKSFFLFSCSALSDFWSIKNASLERGTLPPGGVADAGMGFGREG